MIAVSGRCAAVKVQGRVICRARNLEDMVEHCQFFEPRGVTCRHLRSLGSYRGCSSRPVLEWLDGE